MSVKAATESDWCDCNDPRRLIKAVQKQGSKRKLRLVVVAAARLVWEQLPDGEMQEAVVACEGRAEGTIEQRVLDQYRGTFYGYVLRDSAPEQRQWVQTTALRSVFALVFATTYPDNHFRTLAGNNHWLLGIEPRGEPVSDIIRDVFGNPFRPVMFSSQWRTSTVLALASRMYESRDFGAMPILADALQDAGCDSPDILDHCRGPGPHVRGCWVVDLVFGNE